MKKYINIISISLACVAILSCRENKKSEPDIANQIEETVNSSESLTIEETIEESYLESQEIEENTTDEPIEDNEIINETEEKPTENELE